LYHDMMMSNINECINDLCLDISEKESIIIDDWKIYDFTSNIKENSLEEINNGERVDCVAYFNCIDETKIFVFFRETLTIDKFCSITSRPENAPIYWCCDRCWSSNFRTKTCINCLKYAIRIMKLNYVELYFIDFGNKDIQHNIKHLFCYVIVEKFFYF